MLTQLKIERLGYEGHGVGYSANGEVYFVPGGVPGDLLVCEIPEGAKNYSEVAIEKVLSPSPDRIEPVCRYFQQCGGCDWLQLKYQTQLSAKEQILKHVLSRAGLMPQTIHPISGASETLGYRNRVQFRSEAGKIGFLKKRSHDLVDIEYCATAHPSINDRLKELRKAVSENNPPTKIELAVEGDKVLEIRNQAHGAAGFTQIHQGQNEKLKSLVANLIRQEGAKRVIELFAGSGNLAAAYAESVESILGLESEPSAVAKAAESFGSSDKVRIFQRQVDAYWTRYLPPDELDLTDTLLLDPPRQGSFGALKALGRLKQLKTVIYVSCSPLMFAQEASRYLTDFELTEIYPIDMFPQTRHIELVAVFKYCTA